MADSQIVAFADCNLALGTASPLLTRAVFRQPLLHLCTSTALTLRTLKMSTPKHLDVAEAPDTHNTSSQHPVVENDDPALGESRKHTHNHGHMHHDKHAEQGRKDEVVYSKGTVLERSTIPHQDPQDHDLARRRHADPSKGSTEIMDSEKGAMSPERLDEGDPQSHTLSNFYLKYRIFFHLFIWLVFTG